MSNQDRTKQYTSDAWDALKHDKAADLSDPFRNDEKRRGIILPFTKENGYEIQWHKRITPREHFLLTELGKRCSALIQAIAASKPPGAIMAPHPTHAALQIGVAHLQRHFDLPRMLELDDLTLCREYVEIAKHCDCVRNTFPRDVRLNLPTLSFLDRLIGRFN